MDLFILQKEISAVQVSTLNDDGSEALDPGSYAAARFALSISRTRMPVRASASKMFGVTTLAKGMRCSFMASMLPAEATCRLLPPRSPGPGQREVLLFAGVRPLLSTISAVVKHARLGIGHGEIIGNGLELRLN